MSPTIARLMIWEARRLARDPLGVGLMLLWCALLILATWLGVDRVRGQREEIETLQARDLEAWQGKRAELLEIEAGRAEPRPFRDPRSPTNSAMGQSAARPVSALPTALAALAVGPGDLAPAVIEVGLLTKLRQPPESIENPGNRLTGPIDLNFLASALAPLFLLAFGFDALARDRDTRVINLLGSMSTPLGRVVAARLGAHGLMVGGTLSLAALFASLASGPFSWSGLGEVCAWIVFSWLYVGLWSGVVAWVNLKAWSGASNALVLCGLWLGAVLLLPAAIQALVDTLAPAPDAREVVLETRSVDTDLFKRAEEIRDAYWEADPRRKPASPLNEYDTYYVSNLWPRSLAADAALAHAHEHFDQARARRSAWWRRLGWISPTLAFRLATERLAGMAPEQRQRLKVDAADYQQRLRDHFELKLASMRPLELSDYDTLPEPPEIRFTLAERLFLAWPAMLGVIVATTFVFLAVWRKGEPELG